MVNLQVSVNSTFPNLENEKEGITLTYDTA